MNNQVLEESIGYFFKNKTFLESALVHSSYINEHAESINSNERLEFLGDAVLELAVSELLYNEYADLPEGRLTVMRSFAVCEKSLAEYARKIQLGEFILFGAEEIIGKGKNKPSILADAVEAVIAAIYLDSDYDTAKKIIWKMLGDRLEAASKDCVSNDYKSALQIKLQEKGTVNIEYKLDDSKGPDHDKVFYVSLYVDGNKLSEGSGKKKKLAEQAAAKVALERIS